jgi:hypothetical protein
MPDQPAGQTPEQPMSPKRANGNGSQPPSQATEIPLRELKRPSTPKSAKVERIDQPSRHKSTGPRTPQGKQRSKFNARKHGLFSKAVLFHDESRPEYELLLNGLQESLQPQGKLEEVLVENLAAILWRKRRLLQVEAAEITKARILNFDSALQDKADELEYAHLKESSDGKLRRSSNLTIFENAIAILNILRLSDGGDSGTAKVREMLRLIYGAEKDGALPCALRQLFVAQWKFSLASLKEENSNDSADPTESMPEPIDQEILRLAKLYDDAATIETLKRAHDLAPARVPPQEVSDRLLRIEAHLSREFDRTLSQLERLQRMRKGQPVPPSLKLALSS